MKDLKSIKAPKLSLVSLKKLLGETTVALSQKIKDAVKPVEHKAYVLMVRVDALLHRLEEVEEAPARINAVVDEFNKRFSLLESTTCDQMGKIEDLENTHCQFDRIHSLAGAIQHLVDNQEIDRKVVDDLRISLLQAIANTSDDFRKQVEALGIWEDRHKRLINNNDAVLKSALNRIDAVEEKQTELGEKVLRTLSHSNEGRLFTLQVLAADVVSALVPFTIPTETADGLKLFAALEKLTAELSLKDEFLPFAVARARAKGTVTKTAFVDVCDAPFVKSYKGRL
jgi:hypothetical protein